VVFAFFKFIAKALADQKHFEFQDDFLIRCIQPPKRTANLRN